MDGEHTGRTLVAMTTTLDSACHGRGASRGPKQGYTVIPEVKKWTSWPRLSGKT